MLYLIKYEFLRPDSYEWQKTIGKNSIDGILISEFQFDYVPSKPTTPIPTSDYLSIATSFDPSPIALIVSYLLYYFRILAIFILSSGNILIAITELYDIIKLTNYYVICLFSDNYFILNESINKIF